MKIICVDDEKLLLEDTVSMCLELPEISEAKGFTKATQALDWLKENGADLALLDIDMPDMNGLDLALRIKTLSPDTAIIFLTGYAQYALDAFRVHASGYLLKPVSKQTLQKEIQYAFAHKTPAPSQQVRVKTFGAFDVFVNEKHVTFHLAKSKEILAYLVDRQGGSVKRAELAAILWEERLYDRKLQKQLDTYIRSLRQTLTEYNIAYIIEQQRGTLRIVPETIDCDVYNFFAGDTDAVNAFRGEYMSAYSWASITEGKMYWRQNKI
ncbi:MAG: response regulator [Clostridia bacterium]|nr:response regulator [Clostridia bacterium]